MYNTNLLKNIFVWVIFIGIVSIFRTIEKGKNIRYFSNIILDNFKLSIILDYIVNAYPFSIITEIMLIFFTSMLQLFISVIEATNKFEKEKYYTTYKILSTILAILGFSIFFLSFSTIVSNINTIKISTIIFEIFFQPTLTILFIPFLYFIALYVSYENLFLKIRSKKTISSDIRTKLYLSILFFCNVNINKINDFIKRSKILTSYIKDEEDIQILFQNYRKNCELNMN